MTKPTESRYGLARRTSPVSVGHRVRRQVFATVKAAGAPLAFLGITVVSMLVGIAAILSVTSVLPPTPGTGIATIIALFGLTAAVPTVSRIAVTWIIKKIQPADTPRLDSQETEPTQVDQHGIRIVQVEPTGVVLTRRTRTHARPSGPNR